MQQIEDEWLREGGAPLPDDWVDEELAGGKPLFSMSLILMLTLLLTSVGMTSVLWDDLTYVLSSSTPIELGELTEWGERQEANDPVLADLPDNRLVSIAGIGHRRAEVESSSSSSDKPVTAYYKAIGAPMLIERSEAPRPDLHTRQRERAEDYRPYLEGEGRLRRLEHLPRRYRSLSIYYSRELRTVFCGAPTDPAVIDYIERQRTDARRVLRSELGREPTEDELQTLGMAPPECVYGSLVVLGSTPATMRSRALLWVLLVTLTALMLVRQLVLRSRAAKR